ncbi:zinc ribbon domain-containing protein [Methanocella conradii]|uniref:zinc ribbon domain-containing protein n=1 Tax=Methanocella conradii TaxID=1175444 RepID=UPI00157D8ACE|nr:zinc ribbon domain-containing protein [Methanocella conradii]
MSELLAKVDMVAQSIELYEDELRIQLLMARKHVIPLKDIVDLEFRRAWFFLAGKLVVVYRENDTLKKVYVPFNFLVGRCVESLVAIMIERLAYVYGNKEAIEFLQMADDAGGMVQCPYCSSMISPEMLICPGCGTPKR